MKIDQTHPLTRPTQNESAEHKKAPAAVNDTNTPAGSTTTLSQLGHQDGSADIDTARVNEIRQAIADGRLELDTGKIADGLIQSVRNMLGEDS